MINKFVVSGVTLSREEDDCIWLYNRSDHPVFVTSLTLEDPNSPFPTRVPAEYCLCVYDPTKVTQKHFEWQSLYPRMGPIDPRAIRISFVKGWGGQRYSRKEITACPCWLEILLLSPCRWLKSKTAKRNLLLFCYWKWVYKDILLNSCDSNPLFYCTKQKQGWQLTILVLSIVVMERNMCCNVVSVRFFKWFTNWKPDWLITSIFKYLSQKCHLWGAVIHYVTTF